MVGHHMFLKLAERWQGWPLTWIKTTLIRTHHRMSQHTLMACTRGAWLENSNIMGLP